MRPDDSRLWCRSLFVLIGGSRVRLDPRFEPLMERARAMQREIETEECSR
jgi:hypothetical protein